MMVDKTLKRPAGGYYGSKWKLAPWIIPFIPETHDLYVEPFCGLVNVLLRKPRSPLEIVNDLNKEVTNFLAVLRDHKRELIAKIQMTPYSIHEWKLAVDFQDVAGEILKRGAKKKDKIEAARLFYIRSMMTIGTPTAGKKSGFRRQVKLSRHKEGGQSTMKSAAVSFMNTDHLMAVANRLRGVQLDGIDAFKLIARCDAPSTAFYIDPPYHFSTRKRADGYAVELEDGDHQKLAELLNGLEGMCVLSHYDCKLYDSLYVEQGWVKHLKEARVNGSGTAVEAIYINVPAQNALKAEAEAEKARLKAELAEAQKKQRERYPLLYLHKNN